MSSLTPVAGHQLGDLLQGVDTRSGLAPLWDGISDPSIVGFGKSRQQGRPWSQQDLTEQRHVDAVQLSDLCESSSAVPIVVSGDDICPLPRNMLHSERQERVAGRALV